MTDIDGNTYRTIRHGKLTWMAENLMVSRFHDGTAIDLLQGDAEWASATTPAFSWNLNLETWPQSATGAYYNWYLTAGRIANGCLQKENLVSMSDASEKKTIDTTQLIH